MYLVCISHSLGNTSPWSVARNSAYFLWKNQRGIVAISFIFLFFFFVLVLCFWIGMSLLKNGEYFCTSTPSLPFFFFFLEGWARPEKRGVCPWLLWPVLLSAEPDFICFQPTAHCSCSSVRSFAPAMVRLDFAYSDAGHTMREGFWWTFKDISSSESRRGKDHEPKENDLTGGWWALMGESWHLNHHNFGSDSTPQKSKQNKVWNRILIQNFPREIQVSTNKTREKRMIKLALDKKYAGVPSQG